MIFGQNVLSMFYKKFNKYISFILEQLKPDILQKMIVLVFI